MYNLSSENYGFGVCGICGERDGLVDVIIIVKIVLVVNVAKITGCGKCD